MGDALPALRASDGGILIAVAARPGASRSEVVGVQGEALKVALHAAPEKGKANRELIVVLAKALGLRRQQVTLHAGHTSRNKTVRVEGVSEAELRERLRSALA